MSILRQEGVSIVAGTNSQISPRVTINVFPDEILLTIFEFCRKAVIDLEDFWWPGGWPRTWRTLVHVCHRWRCIVLSSPLQLDLYIDCGENSPVKELLDIWPPFPIQVKSGQFPDNIIAALEHRDRVRQIELRLTGPLCEKAATIIQEPFPALINLHIWSVPDMPALPATILGGSAPRLRSLTLWGVPFPTLPQFLLSCNDLSKLSLRVVSDLGYISPEAIVTGLSALTRLAYLCIDLPGEVPDLHSYRTIRHPPLLTVTRTILPALTEFRFDGVSKYLEDFLSRIDAPRLETFVVTFYKRHFHDIRQVICLSATLGSFSRAEVILNPYGFGIQLDHPKGTDPPKVFNIGIRGDWKGWKVSSMTQIVTQSPCPLSSVTRLDIYDPSAFREWEREDYFEILKDHTEWLGFFRPFSALRTLRLSGDEQAHVVASLKKLTRESITEVLPMLQTVYYREFPNFPYEKRTMEQFFAPRQYSDHPVTLQSA